MNIGLIDVDGHNWPNLPLMKLSAHHKRRGDKVDWWNGLEAYDRVYMSKVFAESQDMNFAIRAEEVIYGGTGYGLKTKLSEEVEHTMPDYSLYPQYSEAYGFLTRGCPRACGFCIVSEKEGRKSVKVANLSEFWSGQKSIKLLDPNLLACREADDLLVQLAQSRVSVDFTQGLDARLLDKSRADLLKKVKLKMVHFAWDDPNDNLGQKLEEIRGWLGLNRSNMVAYVLTNFNSTHEGDLHRVNTLRAIGVDPYVMIYDKQNAPQTTRHLARWVNNKRIFYTVSTFAEYSAKIG